MDWINSLPSIIGLGITIGALLVAYGVQKQTLKQHSTQFEKETKAFEKYREEQKDLNEKQDEKTAQIEKDLNILFTKYEGLKAAFDERSSAFHTTLTANQKMLGETQQLVLSQTETIHEIKGGLDTLINFQAEKEKLKTGRG